LSPTTIIFVGTVESIENPPPDFNQPAESMVDMRTVDQSGYSRYHFRVDEKISGIQTTDIDVFSGRGGGDCSYHFQKGAQYLVFPYQSDDGRPMATICSETRPVELAKAKLAVLRAMRDDQPVASLYGTMRSMQQPYSSVSDEYYGNPVADTRMILRSDKNVLEAKTDANGNYSFFDVPAGKYHVEADLPQHFEIAQTILSEPVPPIDLPQKACYEYDVEVLPTGRIRGKVIGRNGMPLPYASVELYRPRLYRSDRRSFGWSESQDLEKPEFVFEHVAAGDYILVYNDQERIEPTTPYPRMFYPGVRELGQAQIIHVEEGQEISGLEFRVSGGRATRAITVRLVTTIGELPDINYVEARGSDGSVLSEQRLSPGVFSIQVFPGIRYEMHGSGYCTATHKEWNTPIAVVEGSESGPSELVLTFPGLGCPKKPDSTEDKDDDEPGPQVDNLVSRGLFTDDILSSNFRKSW
jgi:hypothetical protein